MTESEQVQADRAGLTAAAAEFDKLATAFNTAHVQLQNRGVPAQVYRALQPGLATAEAAAVAAQKAASVAASAATTFLNPPAPPVATSAPPVVAPPSDNALDTIAAKLGYVKPRIFSDNFASPTLDTSKWTVGVASGASDGGLWSKSSLNFTGPLDPANVTVVPGKGLVLKCSQASGAAVCTYGKLKLVGGLLLFSAIRANSENGAWDAAWTLDGIPESNDNGEIDIFEGGMLPTGPGGTNQTLSSNFHPTTGSGPEQNNYATGIDLTAGPQVYGLIYKPGQSIEWLFNGNVTRTLTNNVSSEPIELIFDLGFADSGTSGWHTQFNAQSGTAEMVIPEVAAYAA